MCRCKTTSTLLLCLLLFSLTAPPVLVCAQEQKEEARPVAPTAPAVFAVQPVTRRSFQLIEGRAEPETRTLVMRYDAPTAHWRRVGTAHVSADGRMVESDEGSGLGGGGWYAFPAELPQPEITAVSFMQIAGNEELEGKALVHLETFEGAYRAVLMSAWGDYEFKRLHFRLTRPWLDADEYIATGNGMPVGFPSAEVAVTVTPVGASIKVGASDTLTAVGRPHPAGYYVWTSSEPSIVSVHAAADDGGTEHPNKAVINAHRPGRARITVAYFSTTGQVTTAVAEVVAY